MITLIGLLLSIKSTENHQRAQGQVKGTPAHNENTKCLVFNTLTVWLKYQFNNIWTRNKRDAIDHFHWNHNSPCLPPKNFAWTLPSICLGTTVIPRRKWKQWLRIFFWGGGEGGKGVIKVHCGLGKNGEQSLFHVTSLPPCWRHLSQNSKTAAMFVS